MAARLLILLKQVMINHAAVIMRATCMLLTAPERLRSPYKLRPRCRAAFAIARGACPPSLALGRRQGPDTLRDHGRGREAGLAPG